MKNFLNKFKYVLLGAGLIFAGTVYAVNITVPSAPTGGYMLISTSTGAFVTATTTVNASIYPGADMGAKINAAYAACPSIGCHIYVPRGTYSYTTPIVFGTNNKVVILEGEGHGGPMGPYPAQVGGTTLNYTPSTGTAVTVDTNYSNARSVIENISIQGPNGTTAASNKGVVFGGTNGGFGGTLEGVHVSGFGTGVYYGAITSFNVIDNSVIDFNGRNVSEPDTAGANCEDMRVSNSIIADANNQAGGATDLYGFYVQESGNCQWNIINTSIDDNQVYIDQFGGVANVWTFTNVHFENPNDHDYRFVDTITNVPATEVNFIGGDLMNDRQSGMASFISMGGDVHFDGTTINGNSDVTVKVTALVAFDNANNNATASWVGLKNNGNGATYVYGTTPMSPFGYGTGLNIGPSIYMGLSTATANGTTTIANLGGVLDATTFPGSDIGAQVNAAYASCPLNACIINIPRGVYYFTTPIVFGTNGKRVLLTGAPAEGTQLFWNTSGAAVAITMDTGIQASGIDHTTGSGIDGIFLHGFSNSTVSPQVGVKIGGVNGCDGCVINATNIFHFGYGYQLSNVHTYHSLLSNSTLRDNGRNVYIQGPPTDAGESHDFINDFIVDAANNSPADCFLVDDYGASSINITGGSIDDCQIHIGVQIPTFTMTGVHMENAGPSWGKYTYIIVGDSQYTNLVIVGGVFVNNATTNKPDQFITSNGAGVSITGLTIFPTAGGQVTQLINGGHAVWSGLNNTSGGVTYIIRSPDVLFSSSGSTATNNTNLGLLQLGTTTAGVLCTGSTGIVYAGCSLGSSFGYPFTVGTFVSTTTAIQFTNGLGSYSSTTVNNLKLSDLSAGFAGVGGLGQVYSFATSTIKTSQLTNDSGFIAAYDAWSHPFAGSSATTSSLGIGTSTPSFAYSLTIASSTAPQLSLSAGTGLAQWAFRNAGGDFFLGTTTVAGTATTSTSALTVSGSGFGTTTVRGLNIIGQATSTSNVGFNITSGCFAIGGTCLSTSGFSNTLANGGTATTTFYNGGVVFSDGLTLTQASSTSGFFYSSQNNRLGLGTSTPFAKLSVNNIAGEPAFVVGSSTGTSFIVDKLGNVGIGTSTPTVLFDSQVNIDANVTVGSFRNYSTGVNAISTVNIVNNIGSTLGLQEYGNGSTLTQSTYSSGTFGLANFSRVRSSLAGAGLVVGAGGNAPLVFITNDAEVGRFLGLGKFAVGTSTPALGMFTISTSTIPQIALSVGTGVAQWTMRNAGANLYFSTTTVVGTATTSVAAFEIRNDGSVYAPFTGTSGSAQTGYWCYDANGQLIRDTTVCLVSARKFKEDIKPLDIGLTELLKVQPVSYYYKDRAFGKGEQIGIIADDIAKIDNRLVGYDNNGDVHSFNYMQYTSWITKAIQDFYGQFQKLVARVSGLEKRVNKQQKEIDDLTIRLNKLENK